MIPAAEVLEGGPPPADICGVEALGGSSKKFGSGASVAGGAVANGTAWTGGEGVVVLVMREEDRVLMVVLKLEEGAGQVEKMVPPSSSL